MHNELLPKKSMRGGDNNLIPLINIVFLLLIFFIIAGQIDPSRDESIQAPLSGSNKPVDRSLSMLTMDSSGVISLDGEIVKIQDLETLLAEDLADQVAPVVAVKADKYAKASDLDRLFDALRMLGIVKITLYSIAREEH